MAMMRPVIPILVTIFVVGSNTGIPAGLSRNVTMYCSSKLMHLYPPEMKQLHLVSFGVLLQSSGYSWFFEHCL